MNETTATLLVDARCQLAEGDVWCGRRHALLWTDIPNARLWMHEPRSARTRAFDLPARLGSFALCASGRLLLGLAHRLCYATLGDDGVTSLTPLVDIEPDLPTTRVNDGRTDRSGNFVFGTMSDDETSELGSFYQFSARHGLRRLDLVHVAIANSICFSLDGRTMYFCDSPRRRILQGDYDAGAARVSNVRDFVVFREDQGYPDGSVIDAEGCLWNAEWGTGMVRRYTPDGRPDRRVAVGTPHASCVAFGGSTNEDLFVTTARKGLDVDELQRGPTAGGIFHAIPGVRGVPDAPFADE